MPTEVASFATLNKSFDNAVATPSIGRVFAIVRRPEWPHLINVLWETKFGSAPAAVNISMEVSLDGVVWLVVQSSTATTGQIQLFQNSGLFIRAQINSITGGSGVTVQFTV